MTHEQHIREQGRIARELDTERQALFQRVPFAQQLERSPPELQRMARPVIAVLGTDGKTALVRALGPQLPWKWMELGAPADLEFLAVDYSYPPGPALPVGEMAEHCLVVFGAGEPISQNVVDWLAQLVEAFPPGTLQVVLTCDEPPPEGVTRDSAHSQLTQTLREAVPQRELPVMLVSPSQPEELEALRDALARQLAERQRTLLEAALAEWSTLLEDLRSFLGMKDLVRVQPETLSRLQMCLDSLLAEGSQTLGEELPRLAHDCARELEAELPGTESQLTQVLRERLGARMEPQREALRERLAEALTRELARDVEGPVPVTLADRFGHLVEPQPLFFDWRLARQAGVVGAGASLLWGAVRKHKGWGLVIGTALLGGVLAGLLGRGKRVRTAEELRRLVTEPLLEDSRQRLEQATATCRADIDRLCHLLRKVVDIFAPVEGAMDDPEPLLLAVSGADTRREQLERELTELQWKHQVAQLQSMADFIKTH